jgi:uncharacterized protein with LGFP repeats
VTGALVHRLRTVVLLGILALVVSGLVSAPTGGGGAAAGTPQLQPAADTSSFRAGNIISDNLFFDGGAMTAFQVQDFLNAKGASCVAGEMPCLKNYTQSTWNRPADAYCGGYPGAPGETAAWIIAKVGASCGISQRVLLVLLDKEQSLVRGSRPSVKQYQKATGYGCPDTAPCDAQYYGFYNQVWNAARKYKVYVANFDDYNYAPFRWNTIRYSPDASCGSSPVYIENNATAALYIYTPYQPNAGALAAGYGTAPCGAYGNRNFWLYYTDWFGSTQSPGGNAVVTRAAAASWLGSPTSSVVCGLLNAGCFQAFQAGSVYWSPTTNAQIVKGDIGRHWAAIGWETSVLGYPTGEEVCPLAQNGCFQSFERGSMYWTAGTGAHTVRGAIYDKWKAQRWETGPLGYPTRDEGCGLKAGGCFQTYQGGSIYWSPATGARTLSPGPVYDTWAATGWEAGKLGYPTGDTSCGLADSGCLQTFQGGSVYSSATTGSHYVTGAVLTKWAAQGWETGTLGYPTGDTDCTLAGGACVQHFAGGDIYSSAATGAHVVLPGAVTDAWTAQGGAGGALGYPTSDTFCGLRNGGCFQAYKNGSIYTSTAGGTHAIVGEVLKKWTAQGWETGPLGYPTGDQDCSLVRGGCFQAFQGGSIYVTPSTGTRVVAGDIATEWAAHSWEAGTLGYPAQDKVCGLRGGGCFQLFEGGMIYSAPGAGTHSVLGAIRTAWAAQGWETGPLGYPTGNEACSSGICTQRFQGGAMVWSAGTGARQVRGAIGDYWTAKGGASGTLALPTGDPICGLARGGCFQVFQGGSVYWTAAYGSHVVSGAIRTAWGNAGWEVGTLGYPKADPVTSGTTTTQVFEGGTLALNTTTGTVTRR